MVPSPWDSLTHSGGWSKCAGANHPQLDRLPKSYFAAYKTPPTPGHPKVPSNLQCQTTMVGEQDPKLSLAASRIEWQVPWRAVCLP